MANGGELFALLSITTSSGIFTDNGTSQILDEQRDKIQFQVALRVFTAIVVCLFDVYISNPVALLQIEYQIEEWL